MTNNSSSALDVADYIVNLPVEVGSLNISNLKLQKLLFYCQAFNLAGKCEPLFKEDVIARSDGPVVEEVYDYYNRYGNGVIPIRELRDDEAPPGFRISAHGIATIASVIEAYGHLSEYSLMDRSLTQPPYTEALEEGENTPIKHSSMKKYYIGLLTDEGKKRARDHAKKKKTASNAKSNAK